MKYNNPLPPEGINTSQTSPLKELLLLSTGFIGLIVAAVLVLGLFADKFAQYIPFETEVELSSSFEWDEQKNDVQLYLQTLANQLAMAQDFPKDMSITVHYIDDKTVNAMATLGGHIIIFRGLLEKLNSENAIAMVLAHEIAHIHFRHPIQSLGRDAVISLALSAVGMTAGDTGSILNSTGLLTALSFSREQEQASDYAALQSLKNYYGHINGATDLFEVLMAENSSFTPHITFLSTHPLSENRIKNILNNAHAQGWDTQGKLTSVPKNIQTLIQQQKSRPNPEG